MNSAPRVVYLDLNHWYDLGAALAGHPKQADHVDILRKLTKLVDEGQLLFPLSDVHYMELTENPREHYRREAADVMRTLSRFVTMAPLERIVDEELAQELHRRFGRPAFPIKVTKFGVGVGFAFGVPGRLRVTGFAEDQRPLIEARLGRPIAELEAEANLTLEYSMLTTPSAIRAQVPGYDPYAARRTADRELASFNVMINTLRTDPEIATRPLDAICARQLGFDIRDNFARALLSGGFVNGFPRGDKEVLTDFLMALPSRRVTSMIHFHYLKDIDRDWVINDLRDIAAVSTAIPYCDIVVTDRKVWDTVVQRAHLDKEFNTDIFCRLTDLATQLGL